MKSLRVVLFLCGCIQRVRGLGREGDVVQISPVSDPELATYDKIDKVMKDLDPKLGIENIKLNRKYLEECPKYQKYLADNIIHNTEYCIIFVNPNHKLPPHFLTELKNKKIPIPQSAGDGHYKSFDELYGTRESLNYNPLPQTKGQILRERKKKLKLPYDTHISKIRGWITCNSCDKPRAVFSRKKFKLSESHEHKRLISYLKEINYVCGEILIPPEGANYELFRQKEVSTDRTKICETSIEFYYYQIESNPIVCGWCCEQLSSGNKNKFQKYKESWKLVIPNCGSIQCISLNPSSKFQGWELKYAKVKSKKKVLKRRLQEHEESEKKRKKLKETKSKAKKRSREDKDSAKPRKKRKLPPT